MTHKRFRAAIALVMGSILVVVMSLFSPTAAIIMASVLLCVVLVLALMSEAL